MKKILEILDFEDKKTNAGKLYVRFKTSEGWMSCFDKKSNEELKKLKDKSANCEISESGDFKNIKKFLSESSGIENENIETEKPGVPQETKVSNVSSVKSDFPQSMKVAYAKDVFCAMCSRISQAEFDGMDESQRLELADLSIKVIKKIESAF